jgi:hypothetical protein
MLVLGENSRPQPTRRRFAGKMRLEWQRSVRGTLRTTRHGCSEPNLCAARGRITADREQILQPSSFAGFFWRAKKSFWTPRPTRHFSRLFSGSRLGVLCHKKTEQKTPLNSIYGGHLKIPRLSSPTTRFQRIQIPRRSAHIRSLYARSTEQIMTTSAVRRRGGQEDSSFQVQNTSRI